MTARALFPTTTASFSLTTGPTGPGDYPAIVDPEFDGFQREYFPTTYVCNTEYDASMPNVLVAWPRIAVKNGLLVNISALWA